MKHKIIGTIMLITFTITGCYKDVEEELYPGSGASCDTTNVKYSVTVTSILQNYGCLGCHSGAGSSGNIRLDSYSAVKQLADNGKLYGSITWSSGFSPMPKGGAKMSTCDISKIKAWIDAGAPNN